MPFVQVAAPPGTETLDHPTWGSTEITRTQDGLAVEAAKQAAETNNVDPGEVPYEKGSEGTSFALEYKSSDPFNLPKGSYDFTQRVFPNDIGADHMGHYMVININVPTKGFMKANGLDPGQSAGVYQKYFTETSGVSKVDQLRYGDYNVPGGGPKTTGNISIPNPLKNYGIGSETLGNFNLSIPRNTKRIAESIALHMPGPLIFNHQNVYEEISLTALGARIGVGTALAAAGVIDTVTRGWMGKIASGTVKTFAGALETGARVMSVMQNPINPAVAIVFANTPQRQFTFELLLAPRSESESDTIYNIIQQLKFHGAPEINPNFGFMWIPPADFDITFYNKGRENTNILRINTCVLERCEVQYDPAGVYSTFRNGHPVAVRLSLGFRELEPVHKLRVLQGF